MREPHRTPTYRLIDQAVPGGIEQFVRSRRTGPRPMPWERIAAEIANATRTSGGEAIWVSIQSLRRWFPPNGGSVETPPELGAATPQAVDPGASEG